MIPKSLVLVTLLSVAAFATSYELKLVIVPRREGDSGQTLVVRYLLEVMKVF